MDSEKLRYLLIVAEEGSISRAAERLYISQSSLSKAIASVEAAIGHPLFRRTSAGMRPTESGVRYLQYAREAVTLEDKALSDLEKIWSRRKKTLITMGFSHLRNAIVLPKSLMDFLTNRPDVQTMFRIARDDELMQGLLEGTIDFAMLTMPLSTKLPVPLRGQKMYEERLLIAVPKDDPLLEKAVAVPYSTYPYLDPADLRERQFILGSRGSGLYELCQSFFEAEHIWPNVMLFEDSIRAATRFAEERAGLCFVNEEMVRLEPSPCLCYCITKDTLPIRQAILAWKASAEQDPVVGPSIQFFCEFLSRSDREGGAE